MVNGCSSISLEKKLTLIRNNEPLYAIIYSNTPSATEMTAVNELSYYIKKITGVDSRKIAEKNANEADKSNAIYIGNTDFARVRGIIPETLGEEEWIIRFFDEAVVIAGGQPRGALYGVYAFMQKYMGIYVLDPYTEVVPKSQDLYIKKANMTGKPKFVIRRIHTGWNNIYGEERFYSFNMATPLFGFNEVKASGGSYHTFGNYINQEEYASSHPEYFSMNPQGQRDTKGYYQLCLTNADVRRIFLEKLLSNITSDRAKAKITGADYPRMYDICQNDFTKYLCCCDECKAVSDREGSESGLLLEFINELADGVRNVYPDVLIRTLAYNFTLRAPEKIRPRENVVICYCINYGRRNYPLPLMDESNSEFQNGIDTWSEITAHMFIWEYGRIFHLHDPGFYIPSSNIGNIQKDLQYLRNRNVSCIFVQNEELYPDPHPFKDDIHSFHPLRTWLYYQMMQDPDQNVEPLLKAFFEGYYGPAAEKMRQYLDYLEMRQQTYEGGLSRDDMGVAKLENGVWIGRKNYYKAYLDLNFFITADRLLREAEKLVAGDDYYRIRVIREFIPVYSALLHLQPLLQEAYCTKDAGFPFDRKDILTRYENIWDTYLDYPVFSTLKQEMAPFIQYRIDLLKKGTGQTFERNDPSLDSIAQGAG